jgi:hypothetical protein|tara:strand:+ start:321 stop:560 length:240 start_codon:yes stop_codon:yes gene_type:complete
MALTKTDKLEIERLIRKEIKDFMKKPQYKNELKKMIQLELKDKKFRGDMIELMSNVLLELYKAFWFRRSFWQSEIKRAK